MQYKSLIIVLFTWVAFSFGACTESEIALNTDRLGIHYFPLAVGDFRIYAVEESIITVLGETNLVYELKEYVADSGTNASNNLFYTIHRLTRVDENEGWNLDSIWTAQKSNNIGVLVENNIPFVKMSFPIAQGINWDGNSLNVNGRETYQYELDVQDTTLFEQTYHDVVKVVQNDLVVVGETNQRYEYYAPDVGMILKDSKVLKFCTQDCKEENELQSGRIIKMRLKSYGKE